MKKTTKILLVLGVFLIIEAYLYYLLKKPENGANLSVVGQTGEPRNLRTEKQKNNKTPKQRNLETEKQKDEGEINGNLLKFVEINKNLETEEFVETQDVASLPESFDLKPDFAPQAPWADWGLPYQEACEEASMIMAAKYFQGQPLDKEIMDQEIKNLVAWQIENFGYYEHTTAQQVAETLRDYFGLSAQVVEEVTAERIKQEIYQGGLVILPCAGQELHNPYYKQPGPVYHMLVVRGWDKDKFITNDPGTKRGEGYQYQYQILIDAIHNVASGGSGKLTPEQIIMGEKMMVVVE